MDVKRFLQNDDRINMLGIAKKMWPGNKSAKSYLSNKLNGTNGRKWTEDDSILAKKALNELGIDISKLK